MTASPTEPEAAPDPERGDGLARYWRANQRVVAALLVVWFVAAFGCGILFAEPLNAVRLPGTGFPLGFWFAQQGSILVFLALIGVYALVMNRLDRRHGVDEE